MTTASANIFLTYFGPAGTLIELGLAGVILILLLSGVNVWIRYQHGRRALPDDDANTVESSPAYRRYRVAAASAAGSTRDWDYRVRPVLADLTDAAMTGHSTAIGSTPTAQAVLGEQLWALVDRRATRSEDRSTPSGGRDELLKILEQLESLPRNSAPRLIPRCHDAVGSGHVLTRQRRAGQPDLVERRHTTALDQAALLDVNDALEAADVGDHSVRMA